MAHKNTSRRRLLIAEEAAKLISEGAADFHSAKQKAATRHGVTATRDLPDNLEIEQALIARQSLFEGDQHTIMVDGLRQTTLALMTVLAKFDPHLVGGVLSGTANAFSEIQLHVFSDDLEAVAIHLLNKSIAYRSIEKEIADLLLPGFEFSWQGKPIELLVFDDGARISPPSPIDGKPMARASKAKVTALLERG